VSLLAPAGAVLLGPGAAAPQRLVAWGATEVARLFDDEVAGSALGLGRFDAAIAYTRNPVLIRNLRGLAARVEGFDPEPAPGAGHASEWLARPVAALGLDVDARPPTAVPSPGEAEQAQALAAGLPDRFLAIHPGSGSVVKNWPAERYGELARRLAPHGRWLLVEGPADSAAVSALRDRPGAVTVRDVPLRVLGALLARARVYVGNDSGVSHLAAAWGAPTVALFGPTDPSVWAPRGPMVEVLREPRIASIPVDAVVAAAARAAALRSTARGRPSG
jgi:Glycosyltransferase family 9 (heptosyltransferase)